jgi:uncharacterized membrane protein
MTTAPLIIVSHPHRSLGSVGFRALLCVVIGANAIGAIYFSSLGAWPVAGFMGLDVIAVLVAFRLSYAQARAFERISIDPAHIVIEQCDAKGKMTSERFPSYWAQVVFEGDETQGQIRVRSHGRSIAVGTHLPGPERHVFAGRLKDALREVRSSVAGVET